MYDYYRVTLSFSLSLAAFPTLSGEFDKFVFRLLPEVPDYD